MPLHAWLAGKPVVVVGCKRAGLEALRAVLSDVGVEAEVMAISSAIERSLPHLRARFGAHVSHTPIGTLSTIPATVPQSLASAIPGPLPMALSGALPSASTDQPTATLIDHDRQRRTATLRSGECLFVVEIPRDPEQPSQVRITHGEEKYSADVRFAVADSLYRYAEVAARALHQPAPVIQRHLHAVRAVVEHLIAEVPAASAPRAHGSMSEADRDEAESWLRADNLSERITNLISELGWHADPALQLLGFLTALSRRCDEPAWLAFSATHALPFGAHVIAEITPPEDIIRATCLSELALTQMESDALRHRLLVIDDLAVSAKVATTLRVLSVNACLTAQQTLRDPETGVTRLRLHRVDGPVALLGAVTAGRLDSRLDPYVATVPTDTADGHAEENDGDGDATHVDRPVPRPLPRPNPARRAQLIHRMHVLQRILGSATFTITQTELVDAPHGSAAVQRDHRILVALASASALLHRRRRPEMEGSVVVNDADVETAQRLMRLGTGPGTQGISPEAEHLVREWRTSGGIERTIASWQEQHPHLSRHALDKALRELIDAGRITASGGGQRGSIRTFQLPAPTPSASAASTESTAHIPEYRAPAPAVFDVFERYSTMPNAIKPVRGVG